ncbi:protein FAR1-RELATED SEQUENCE 5-like [Apium graveolens]|uniref:protein FAR1-RELATED SEQUENCE 5-like n=1 Tax=Apium graveolens TaxID=4045 RepID=UPI003D7B213D
MIFEGYVDVDGWLVYVVVWVEVDGSEEPAAIAAPGAISSPIAIAVPCSGLLRRPMLPATPGAVTAPGAAGTPDSFASPGGAGTPGAVAATQIFPYVNDLKVNNAKAIDARRVILGLGPRYVQTSSILVTTESIVGVIAKASGGVTTEDIAISAYDVPCIGGRLGSSTKLNVDDERKEKRRIRDVIPRTNCSARMCVTHRVKNNKWEVTLVKSEHDHDMVTSDKVQFMQRSKNIDPVTRALLELFDKSGIETAKAMRFLGETWGGVEKLGFSNQDVRNVIRDIRRRVFDSGDVGSEMALLRQLKEKSFGNFFYRVDLDEENRVRGLVWVDHRSLNAYTNFGDVISFDSTYRTNRYCMSFIQITGVNHHYQNILFGFALMRDETEISYKWVLKTWLEAVENKPPLTIITDQDIALENAIAEILPDTKHILCSWHISNKFPEKLSTLYTQYSEFKGDFNDCLYKSLSPTEFVGKWEVLVDKYGLEDHVCLNDMYAIKDKWIRAYTKQHFSAGMTTTSRSESMNSFFDEYVKASTGLKEFIENSQKALETQILNEVKADYETEYKERRLIFNSSLENHASSIYTKEMFRQFQNELRKSTSYVVNSCKDGSNYMWKLYERSAGREEALYYRQDG